MNVVYASDNNFAEMLGISMLSLFENNKNCRDISVYVLDSGIDENNKNKLNAISETYGRKIFFFDALHLQNNEMKQQRGSAATFSRLYIGKLLPDGVDKVLYLDCDILIRHSLEELFDIDISDNYCAGVRECLSDARLEQIGLLPFDLYVNAGVLLINLKLWRDENITEKFIGVSGKYDNNVPYADQGMINAVISGKSICAELKYNCYTVLFDFDYNDLMIFRKPSEYYSEEEVKAAVNDPAVVHFTTSFLSVRPWVEGCGHPFAGEWLKYKKMSPWADVPLRRDNRPRKKKVAVNIYRSMPHRLAVGIAGWLHSTAVPKLKR